MLNITFFPQLIAGSAVKSVYLYEIDENTIGVLADMDNNLKRAWLILTFL